MGKEKVSNLESKRKLFGVTVQRQIGTAFENKGGLIVKLFKNPPALAVESVKIVRTNYKNFEEVHLMKKIFALCLMLLMALGITGCGGEDKPAPPTTKIGFLGYLNSDEVQFTKYVQKIVGNYTVNAPVLYEAKFFDNLNSMQMALEAGQIDEISILLPVARYMVARNPQMRILEDTPMGKPFMNDLPEDVSEFANDFCFAVTEDKTELKAQLEGAINSLRDNGTLKNLIDTYIKNFDFQSDPEAVQFATFEGAETIKIAVTGDLPPLDLVTADGKAAGFNTALLSEVGKILNKNIELIQIESGARAAALTSGQADVSFWNVVPISQVIPKNADTPDGIVLTAPYYRGATVHVAIRK